MRIFTDGAARGKKLSLLQYLQPRVASVGVKGENNGGCGMNRAWHVTRLVVAAALCGVVAVGVTRWPDIQFELGYAYEKGDFHGWAPGFTQDYRKVSHWLSRAAQANHPRAQYMLGILYAHGWGVPKDGTQAVEWFTRSARNGYGPACYHLGWMVHKGEELPRDDGRAVRLLE